MSKYYSKCINFYPFSFICFSIFLKVDKIISYGTHQFLLLSSQILTLPMRKSLSILFYFSLLLPTSLKPIKGKWERCGFSFSRIKKPKTIQYTYICQPLPSNQQLTITPNIIMESALHSFFVFQWHLNKSL